MNKIALAVVYLQIVCFISLTLLTWDSSQYVVAGNAIPNDTALLLLHQSSNNNTRRQPRRGIGISPRNRTILFVHIGKAGGETIKSVLEAGCRVKRNKKHRNECLDGLPESRLSQMVKGYYHCFHIEPSGMANQADSYLFNVRHPVDRSISWFRYVSPFNCAPNKSVSPNCQARNQLNEDPNGFVGAFFQTCFRDVEDWAYATVRRRKNGTEASAECAEMALTSLGGRLDWRAVPLAAHMTANYRDYTLQTTQMHKDKEVLVVRIDFMWDDLRDLDIYLGGTGDFGEKHGSRHSHGSEAYSSSSSISVSAAKLFCCALYSEMKIYRALIMAATNLHPDDKRETCRTAVEQCGFSTWDELANECSKQTTASI